MPTATKRKTSVTLNAAALDEAKELGINVSEIADDALIQAVENARREKWLSDNASAFDEQAEWHERNGHPLADIISAPGQSSWKN